MDDRRIFHPNTTQTPNFIFDELMSDKSIGELEFKIICAVTRKTYGWHKEEDAISISQLMIMTGGSRRGVIYAIKRLLDKGLIIRTGKGFGRESSRYKLLVVQPVHQSENLVVQSVHPTGAMSSATVRTAQVQSVVQPMHPQNTKNKSTKLKNESPVPNLSIINEKEYKSISKNGTEGHRTAFNAQNRGAIADTQKKPGWNDFIKYLEQHFTPETAERYNALEVRVENNQINIFSETSNFERNVISGFFSKFGGSVSFQLDFKDIKS